MSLPDIKLPKLKNKKRKRPVSSSAVRELHKKVKQLEEQGFIVPRYVKNIKSAKTAKNYNQIKLMEVSKYREIYQGKERIVSGERGRELILSARAVKASQTRKRRQIYKFGENTRANQFDSNERPSQDYFTREAQADMLDARLRQYFDQFMTPTLGRKFESIYESEMSKYENRYTFLFMLLDVKSDVIAEVQKAIAITPSDVPAQDQSYAEWLLLLTNSSPTEEQKREVGNAEDEQWQVVADEAPWG